MIITTARKPSSKTRTFCRHLGRFTGCEYIPRGKSSLLEIGDEAFLVVGDHKGNPGSFNFFIKGTSVLSIRASVSMDKEVCSGEKPVIEGDSPLALALSKATGFDLGGSSGRIIRVDDLIEFIDRGTPVITLDLLGIRGAGLV